MQSKSTLHGPLRRTKARGPPRDYNHPMIIGFMIATVLVAAPNSHPVACKEASPGLQVQARISCAAARHKAIESIGGEYPRVVSPRLEEESGRLVYSFDNSRARRTCAGEGHGEAHSGEGAVTG